MDEGRIKGSVFEKSGHLVARHVSPACVHGDQIGHGSAVDRNSQALTGFDLTEYLTDPVAQLPLRNRSHTDIVAYLLRAGADWHRSVCQGRWHGRTSPWLLCQFILMRGASAKTNDSLRLTALRTARTAASAIPVSVRATPINTSSPSGASSVTAATTASPTSVAMA